MIKCISGFTLIETVCVVAILGITTAIITPLIGPSLDRWAVRSAAQQVVTGIRQTRQMAITLNKEMELELHKDGKYKIREYNAPFNPSYETVYLNDRLDEITSTINDNNYSMEIVAFKPNGRPILSGTITLKAGEQQADITIMPVTGRVKIK